MNLDELYKKFDLRRTPSSIKDEAERERIKQEILTRIDRTKLSFNQQNVSQERRNSSFFLKIAASVLLFLLGGMLAYNFFFKQETEPSYLTFSSPKGRVIQLLLPDSSKIWLNSASTIKYPKHFKNTRDVYLLEGEAFFDVSHHPEKPFIVHTSSVSTRVLGTAFSVKAYKALSSITVTVQRGKVRVDEKERNLGTLTPNKQLVFRKSDHAVRNETVNSAFSTAWKQGECILTGAYFDEIMLAISNRFNVDMVYDRKVFSNCQNSIRFTQNQTLSDVLSLLKEIQGIKYTIKNNQVLITGNECK